jgi:hypothetical protein
MATDLPTTIDRHATAGAGRARDAMRFRVVGVAASALIAAALLVTGCGGTPNRNAAAGTTVVQEGVAYSVQISRELNALAPDDRALLGRLAGTKAIDRPGTTLVGVFLQARDDAFGPRRAVAAPLLVTAFGETFRPLPLGASDPFAYHGRRLAPGDEIPGPLSPAADDPEDGAVLIYRVPTETFVTDRPFTLRFGVSTHAASVQLDV